MHKVILNSLVHIFFNEFLLKQLGIYQPYKPFSMSKFSKLTPLNPKQYQQQIRYFRGKQEMKYFSVPGSFIFYMFIFRHPYEKRKKSMLVNFAQ